MDLYKCLLCTWQVLNSHSFIKKKSWINSHVQLIKIYVSKKESNNVNSLIGLFLLDYEFINHFYNEIEDKLYPRNKKNKCFWEVFVHSSFCWLSNTLESKLIQDLIPIENNKKLKNNIILNDYLFFRWA